ncbi:MAG: RlmE family RNA methyltransferase [Burkholderiaceae bacterium]|nr:RlmE family RNA methyltransferase [Burkholderiaceae bacterium]
MKVQTKSKKVNKAWLHDHVTDPYVQRAHKEGFRSRAAYKLEEIDQTCQLLRPGQVVVDLGAAPGAWSQYVRRRFAPKSAGVGGAAAGQLDGTIVALDLLEFEPIEGVHFLQGDFREQAVLDALVAALGGRRVDVVLSDMAPNLSGIDVTDAARVAHLVELALEFAQAHLTPKGALVCKVFHGSGYSQLVEAFRMQFRVVKAIKPKASRDRSAETFLVGIGLKERR